MVYQETLAQGLAGSQFLLSNFLNGSNLENNLKLAFSNSNLAANTALSLIKKLALGEITIPISIIPNAEINNAQGAFAADNNTIYLAEELLATEDIDLVTKVLLEETGHYIDSIVNSSDAPGDEGAIFASLVLDEDLDSNHLALLQAEDDSAIVTIDGKATAIEQMATIYVDTNAEGDSDGSSWANAHTDLQDALAVAGNGDEIWIAQGTYLPVTEDTPLEDIDDIREVSLEIPSGVELYGGFDGVETALSQRDIEDNETILSGNIGANTAGDNSYHVVDITGTTASTIIDGVTISDGRADGDDSGLGNNDGGGIFGLENASATIRNSTITNNAASDNGGGLLTGRNSSPRIINTTFNNNSSDSVGGAISFIESSSPSIVGSLFYDNQSQFGGAIYHDSRNNFILSDLEITNSTFDDNVAGEGNSLYTFESLDDTVLIENSILWSTSGANNAQIVDSQISSDPVEVNNSIITGGYEVEGSENNFASDPLFVNLNNDDFRLQINSPGIDAGSNDAVNLDSISNDIIGNPRIYNDTVDIGAYEYGGLMSIEDVRLNERENSLTGAEIQLQVFSPLETPSSEAVTTTIGDGVEFVALPSIQLPGSFLVDVNIDIIQKGEGIGSIFFEIDPNETSNSFALAEFNGYVFTDISDEIPAIENVTIDSSTNAIGLEADDINFTENTIEVNVEGLSFSSGDTWSLNVEFADV